MNHTASINENSSRSALTYAENAMHLLKQGLHKQAEESLEQAIAFEPHNAQWHLELARIQRKSYPEKAKHTYEVAKSLGSTNAELEMCALYADVGVIEYLPPTELWKTDRLDISVKLLFAQISLGSSHNRASNPSELYRRHIVHRTNGKEPESFGKASIEAYEKSFTSLIQSIQEQGFLKEFSIPIDSTGKILNGAHRLAAALALELNQVPVVRLPSPWKALDWGMLWFLQNGFSPQEINQLLRLWIEAHPDETGLLLIEHFGHGVPAEFMTELRHQFPLLAWRDLSPVTALFPLSEKITAPPRGPWRYAFINNDERTLNAFCEEQNKKYVHRLYCQSVSKEKHQAWIDSLLNESVLASWHTDTKPLPDSAPSIKHWMQYGQ